MPRMTRPRSISDSRCSCMSSSSMPCSAALWSTATCGAGRRAGRTGGTQCLTDKASAVLLPPMLPTIPHTNATVPAARPLHAAHLHHCPRGVVALDDAIAEHEGPGGVLPQLIRRPAGSSGSGGAGQLDGRAWAGCRQQRSRGMAISARSSSHRRRLRVSGEACCPLPPQNCRGGPPRMPPPPPT